MNFDFTWFLSLPGMFITGGVVLLIIALIILLVTNKKSKKGDSPVDTVVDNAEGVTPEVNSIPPVNMDPVAPITPEVNVMPAEVNVAPVEPVAPTPVAAPAAPQPEAALLFLNVCISNPK